jgi:hypothetical protein
MIGFFGIFNASLAVRAVFPYYRCRLQPFSESYHSILEVGVMDKLVDILSETLYRIFYSHILAIWVP